MSKKLTMLFNYLKVALRNFLKDIRFSAINVTGLSLGLFSFLVIIFYVSFESGFDGFHANSDRIYRMGWDMKSPDGTSHIAVTTAAPAPDLAETFPEIESFCRFSGPYEVYFVYDREDYQTEKFFYADSGFFDLFSFRLLQGDKETCLDEAFTIILSESIAARIFGRKDPTGEILNLNNQFEFRVTGIMEDPPANSHIRYSAIASFSSLYKQEGVYLDWNGGVGYFSYLLFKENNSPSDLGEDLEKFYYDRINHIYEPAGWKVIPYFEKLEDIHLKASGEGSIGRRGNRTNNRIFTVIALFILILACMNFMNLSTARYTSRSGELGVRKVFGATRMKIILQYMGESVFFTAISMIIALILLEILLPFIREMSGTEIQVYTRDNILIIAAIPLLVILTGALAGSYPSFFLSSFSPASIMHGILKPGKGNAGMRNILVVFQFTVSIGLIICTMVVSSQLKYIRNKDLGFEKEKLLALPMTSFDFRMKQAILQQETGRIPGVVSTAATGYMPGADHTSEGYFPEGYDNSIMINRISVDHNYISATGLEVISGRAFSIDFPTDSTAFIVNEAFAKKMGWDDPVGKTIRRNGEHKIIGMVKDFHYTGMNEAIEPLILNLIPYDGFSYLLVKYENIPTENLIRELRKIWKEADPEEPFDYRFVDDSIQRLYESELKFGRLFMVFSFLSVLIASMGIFGLAAFEAEKRKKEIGIRKILGASVNQITTRLVSRFLLLVLISNIVSWPIAWYLMKGWLNNFAYRTSLSPLFFLAGAILSLLIGLITVWMRSYRIANLNPADTIRCE